MNKEQLNELERYLDREDVSDDLKITKARLWVKIQKMDDSFSRLSESIVRFRGEQEAYLLRRKDRTFTIESPSKLIKNKSQYSLAITVLPLVFLVASFLLFFIL